MSAVARAYTFTDGTDAYGSQVENEFTSIFNAWNNHDAGTSKWTVVSALNASATPLIADNSTGTNAIAEFKDNSTSILKVLDGGYVQGVAGAVGTPTFSFLTDTDTGIFLNAANELGLAAGGAQVLRLNTTNTIIHCLYEVDPVNDNSVGLGITTKRWKDVWAVNGTIQTSMTSTKTNIRDMDPKECKIPKAIFFNRPMDTHSKQQLGFAADGLPEEAHPVINSETGERSPHDVYTGSVLAMLCQAARNDYERLQQNEARIASLEKTVESLRGSNGN